MPSDDAWEHLARLEGRTAVKPQRTWLRSYEPGEEWAFCYPDDLMIDGVAGLPGEDALKHHSAPR